MADERLKAWLRQARADLDAGKVDALQECHRRYWLQQACEKGIKALGQILWNGPPTEDGRFRRYFLHQHSPLKQLAREAKDPAFPRSLRFLLRQLDAELEKLDGQGLLRRLDSTTPTTEPTDASYRYPFRDAATAKEIAPVDWSTDDWDAYQGNALGVAAAVDRFLRAVENRRQRGRAMG